MTRSQRFLVALFSPLALLPAVVLAQTKPPAAPVRDVTDTYFGQSVVDPYRWMENTKDPEVVAWMKAQNDYTRAVLERIPGRSELLSRIQALDNAGVTVPQVQRGGEHFFYFKVEPGSDNRKLYVRDGLKGQERLLVDPEKLGQAGKHWSIDYFSPSLDGTYVAYGVSEGGSENSVLHVLESATGKALPDSIDRVQVGAISWRRDGRSFTYNRLQKLAPNSPPTDKYRKSLAGLHALGTDPEKEPPVFGMGLSKGVKISEDDLPLVVLTPASPWAFGLVIHGVQNEATIYAAPLDALGAPAEAPWHLVADVEDAVTAFDARGDTIYLLTHKNASRFKVLATGIAHPDIAKAGVLVAPSEAVITAIGVAEDALYVRDLDGGLGRLRRVPFEGGVVQPVGLPSDGSAQSVVTDPKFPGALVSLTSWTRSPLWLLWDPKTARATDTGLVPPSPVDFSGIESEEVKARSADGTMVPLSIIHKKGLVRDGSNPAWLTGYGAYGISFEPAFLPTRLSWYERGGVLAVSHVRGGGEYGEDWHRAGQKLTKQHTIDDFLACAQYLIDQKYTSPARLAGEGTSAGGITIGGAITQRPDLFGAALIRVGDSDALRSELMESGPANIPEFGTVKDPDGFKALYAMDAYQHVKPGTAYPAVLLTTGTNDPRVAPWQAAKMTARLQASTTSGKPILLRVDYDAGHGLGSTKSQGDTELADEQSFLFWQLGVPPFAASK
ncbi:MAG TPA: prolyl oligopeptidase family serine peptidase [Thermoanaerobaculia bacterium]|nr:prolyl oligopeptidase family serine peptidase [Thermoanaerobaculia bacterium]